MVGNSLSPVSPASQAWRKVSFHTISPGIAIHPPRTVKKINYALHAFAAELSQVHFV